MYLLVFHFQKGEESDKSVLVPNLPEILLEIFNKDSINKFENPSCLPSITSLYSLQSTTKFNLLENVREGVIEILHQHCGMGTYCFQSRDNDEIFCKIQYDDSTLLKEAESTHYLLKMRSDLSDNETVSNFMPYVPYVSNKNDIYEKYNESVFKDIDRIRLMEEIIRAHIRIEALNKYGIILDFYPLHDLKELESIKSHLLGFNLNKIDADKMRNYLGEKFCLYFLWLEFYANELFSLGLLGIGVWIYTKFYGHEENESSFLKWVELSFAVLVCIWCAMFLIRWQRKSNFLALKFGTKNCKQKEFEREQFQGKTQRNPITSELEKTFDKKTKLQRQILTTLTTFFMVGLVVAFTLSLFFYRALLIQGGQRGWGPMLIATLNTLQIYIMNLVYDSMAIKLNDWENHKTETEYENGLIVKKVGYQFVNYFISLYYIAFLKEHWDGCDNNNCMKELNYNLWVMFGLNMIFNVIEIGLPVIKAKSKWNAEEKKVGEMVRDGKAARLEISTAEKQGKQEILVVLNEYLEVVMNFGYIIFFCVAFPLGPAIYWLFNVLEIKGDAYKFFTLCKRPFPREAENIGVWDDVLKFLSIVGVITNTALMIFTANIFELSIEDRWRVFIVVEHLMIFVMVMILNYYPKEFSIVKDLGKKHEMLKDLHFYKNIGQSGGKKAYGIIYTTDTEVHFKDNDS